MTPAGTSNELDVQNGWEENTHTTLFDPRLSVHSQREVGKFSSVAIGMASETIATYMALRAGVIGQQRHSTSS